MTPDLRAVRTKLGKLTQTQAGQLFGATMRTWQDWEAGHRKPHLSTLLLIEWALEHPDTVGWLEAKRAKREQAAALGELARADANLL